MHGCHAVTGGPIRFTHVPPAFLEKHEVSLPIWVPFIIALAFSTTLNVATKRRWRND